jgi:hypothetical protein
MKFIQSDKVIRSTALEDIMPEIDRLAIRASEKIRDYFFKGIENLKESTASISLAQQTIFLKHRELFWFLMDHFSPVGSEIHQNYITTASTYYSCYFEKYIKAMQGHQSSIGDKLDLIGCEEGARRIIGLFGTRQPKEKPNLYAVGDRIVTLINEDSGIILLFPDDKSQLQTRYTFEEIFKSVIRLFLDNASSEFVFCSEFFGKNNNVHLNSVSQAVFHGVFEPCFRIIHTFLKSYLDSTFDALGVLLCIRLTNQCIRLMQRRCLPCLDGVLHKIIMQLWPKYQSVMDLHTESLKNVLVSKVFASKDHHPHFVL